VLTDILPSSEKKRSSAPPAQSVLPVMASLDALPWEALEERLTERIHKQVIERLNFILDDRISQHLSTILEKMPTQLAEEIKSDMQNTLEVIVTHAISSELQYLRKNEPQLQNSNILPET
jgi:hypothetical protein